MRRHELTERLLRLRSVPIFSSVPSAELAPLAATMRAASFERGDLLLREDAVPASFHVLLSGEVTMRRRGEKLTTISAPGGVGFLSVLARTSGGTEAVAESRTQTFEVRADALSELFEDHFPLLLETMRWLAERMIQESIVGEPRPYVPPEHDLDRRIGAQELGIVERMFLVRQTVGFRGANVNSLVRLARRMREERYEAGETVWRPGDPATSMLFLVKGRMELSWLQPETGETATQIVGPGYLLGGSEPLAASPRWNELVAKEPVVLLSSTHEAIVDMLEDDLEVALHFLSVVAGFLLELWDRRAGAYAGER